MGYYVCESVVVRCRCQRVICERLVEQILHSPAAQGTHQVAVWFNFTAGIFIHVRDVLVLAQV